MTGDLDLNNETVFRKWLADFGKWLLAKTAYEIVRLELNDNSLCEDCVEYPQIVWRRTTDAAVFDLFCENCRRHIGIARPRCPKSRLWLQMADRPFP